MRHPASLHEITCVHTEVADCICSMQETVKTTMETNMHQTSRILNLVDIQRQSFMDRKQKYIEIRNQACLAINSGFKSKLKTGRNWKGQVSVDHDSGTVVLSVTPNKGASLAALVTIFSSSQNPNAGHPKQWHMPVYFLSFSDVGSYVQQA